MKFQYFKLPLVQPDPLDNLKYKYRPLLTVEITCNGKAEWVDALIDSGADYNMASLELAEVFEIPLASCKRVEVRGIEQTTDIKLYFHPVVLKVGGCAVQTEIGFGGNLPTILLGQKGFFDKFKKISFEYPKDIEIKPFG